MLKILRNNFNLTKKAFNKVFPLPQLPQLNRWKNIGIPKHFPKSCFAFKIKSQTAEVNIPTQSYPVDKIRNIGIIAHIDAGKTTTTERMLFYSGVIEAPGEVHDGNTVTDYLQQERERGITIRAAAISFDWKDYQINLIDTPGHIDFTAEVERSLRVLDGAVLILDASMGVETQTITVWKQADKYNLPRIAYINKIDKAGASVESTLIAMYKRLGGRSILINYPIGEENMFSGLVDLISFQLITFKDTLGLEHKIENITPSTRNFAKYQKLREVLIEEVASHDENIMNLYLEGKEIPIEELILAIRRLLVENKLSVVLCGSSLKNKGVQQLLDSVVAFLPSPDDSPTIKAKRLADGTLVDKHCSNKNGKLSGLIFKIINEKEKGTLAFFKVYEGVLKSRSFIKYPNKTMMPKERVIQILRMKADECLQLSEIKAGDIGAIIGLKEAKSGDTIIEDADSDPCVLPGVPTPDPVFFCSISPKRNSDYKSLMGILEEMSKEDPSIQVKYDNDTAQTLICGLGELHLEIIRDRIELEYGITAVLGKMKVSFKESIRRSARAKFTVEKEFNAQKIFFEVDLEVYPIEGDYLNIDSNDDNFDVSKLFEKNDELNEMNSTTSSEKGKPVAKSEKEKKFIFNITRYPHLDLEKDSDNPLQLNIKFNKSQISFDFENSPSWVNTVKGEDGEEETFKSLNLLTPDEKAKIFESVLESLNSGSLMGYQLSNVGVRILNGKFSTSRTNELAIKIGIAESLKSLLSHAEPNFMEPYMLLEVVVPNYASSQVISDLTSVKRGKVISIICENENTGNKFTNLKSDRFPYDFLLDNNYLASKVGTEDLITKIYAVAPLSELIGYAAYIRSISKGEGKFFMKFHEFDHVSQSLHGKILNGTYFYE